MYVTGRDKMMAPKAQREMAAVLGACVIDSDAPHLDPSVAARQTVIDHLRKVRLQNCSVVSRWTRAAW